jgi:uncharacterized protein YdhG (YjbR/CyaY superfamily)
METTKARNIDEYITAFPEDIRELLEQMRMTIQKAAPKTVEVISYGMPAFKQHSVLVYFAAYKGHIGFYPTGSGIEAFKKEIAAYKSSKGAVQFPLDKPLPVRLIRQMVKFRVKDDEERAKEKAKKRK